MSFCTNKIVSIYSMHLQSRNSVRQIESRVDLQKSPSFNGSKVGPVNQLEVKDIHTNKC